MVKSQRKWLSQMSDSPQEHGLWSRRNTQYSKLLGAGNDIFLGLIGGYIGTCFL